MNQLWRGRSLTIGYIPSGDRECVKKSVIVIFYRFYTESCKYHLLIIKTRKDVVI